MQDFRSVLRSPECTYRGFSLSKLGSPTFRHLRCLFFWPVFMLLFTFVERFYPVDSYHVVHCALDDVIPVCEWFVIPYVSWFAVVFFAIVYTMFYDIAAFKRLMRFIILTYSVSILIYLVFPTCQNLRPSSFAEDNGMTRFLIRFYRFDTNTNVCPSIHVLGAIAALFGLYRARGLDTPVLHAVGITVCVAICLSTVFLKQHSVIDVAAALVLAAIAAVFCRKAEQNGSDLPPKDAVLQP